MTLLGGGGGNAFAGDGGATFAGNRFSGVTGVLVAFERTRCVMDAREYRHLLSSTHTHARLQQHTSAAADIGDGRRAVGGVRGLADRDFSLDDARCALRISRYGRHNYCKLMGPDGLGWLGLTRSTRRRKY